MISKKLQREIRTKRNAYLFGLIEEFKSSEEEQTIFNCYDYVKTAVNLNKENFYDTLSTEIKDIITKNFDIWFIPIESQSTFKIFLDTNNINII